MALNKMALNKSLIYTHTNRYLRQKLFQATRHMPSLFTILSSCSPCDSADLREAISDHSYQQIIAYEMFLLIYILCAHKGNRLVKMASSQRPVCIIYSYIGEQDYLELLEV